MARNRRTGGRRTRIVREGKKHWRGVVRATGGGFRACVAAVERDTPMRGGVARGYCANRIHEVTGRWPGRKGRK